MLDQIGSALLLALWFLFLAVIWLGLLPLAPLWLPILLLRRRYPHWRCWH